MRNQFLLVVSILGAAVGPSAAQPVTHPTPCEVTISRAPDDVRAAIEAWVKAEPRCVTTLDVRAIPTDGGFYLFARDGAARVRERVVPDAQSAGVLVASWIADDLVEATPEAASDEPPELPAEPSPPPAPPIARRPMIAVAAGAAATGAPAVIATAQPDDEPRRWLTLGGIVQMHGDGAGGLRGEIDLARRGPWALGAVLAGSSAHLTITGNTLAQIGYIETVDIRALAQLSRTSSLSKRWDLRLAVGAGVTSTHASGRLDTQGIEGAGMFPTAEGSLLFTRNLGAWGLALGPVLTWSSQTYMFRDDMGGAHELQRRDLEVMAFGGLRRRL